MSRGAGRVERYVIELLEHNEPLSAATLAALVFQEPSQGEFDIAVVTAAQLASVRRVLAKLQRKGLAFNLGWRYEFGWQNRGDGRGKDVRPVYADRAHALAKVTRDVERGGTSMLQYYSPRIAELYADSVASDTECGR